MALSSAALFRATGVRVLRSIRVPVVSSRWTTTIWSPTSESTAMRRPSWAAASVAASSSAAAAAIRRIGLAPRDDGGHDARGLLAQDLLQAAFLLLRAQ